MALRTSSDSSDPTFHLLVNDTLLDDSSDFIGHVSAPLSGQVGAVQLLVIIAGIFYTFFPENIRDVIESWGQIGQTGEGLKTWPTDFTRDIVPVPCHSHNDYWRRVPLYSAISAGCISVEADVWLFDEELYVGHSTQSLTHNRTLKALYIDPLMDILLKQNPTTDFYPNGNNSRNGVFDTDPNQPLTLVIEIKTHGPAAWPFVLAALEPLRARNYLARWNGTHVVEGPVVVVGTGKTPFEKVNSDISNPDRDIFFDAPLDAMWEDPESKNEEGSPVRYQANMAESFFEAEKAPGEAHREEVLQWASTDLMPGAAHQRCSSNAPNTILEPVSYHNPRRLMQLESLESKAFTDPNIYTTANSYYASVGFGDTLGRMWRYRLSPQQMSTLRGQIQGAHKRGLKVRYWDLPDWPIGLRNHVWTILTDEGVDLLNVDDLKAATRLDWRNGGIKHR